VARGPRTASISAGSFNRSDESRPAVSRRHALDAFRDLKHWILPYHGKKPLDEITSRDYEELLAAWREKGLLRKRINNKASIYRVMICEAGRLGIIPRTSSPWARVEGSKHANGILSMEEARVLLNLLTIAHNLEGQPALLLRLAPGIGDGDASGRSSR
jgi:hypothetical protein